MPNFKATVGHDGPDLVAPTRTAASPSPDMLFLPLVVGAIVLDPRAASEPPRKGPEGK